MTKSYLVKSSLGIHSLLAIDVKTIDFDPGMVRSFRWYCGKH